ncbi:MAG: hypothetical protein ABI405_12565 [Parafilimonas sp.]
MSPTEIRKQIELLQGRLAIEKLNYEQAIKKDFELSLLRPIYHIMKTTIEQLNNMVAQYRELNYSV